MVRRDTNSPRRSMITLGVRHWTYVAIFALIVLPLILIVTFLPQIDTAYRRQFRLPQWEVRFGFSHGPTRLRFGDTDHEVFAITRVTPGGVFHRAGILPGDVPVGYQHGFESGFYGDLGELESGRSITLNVINAQTRTWRSVVITAR